MQTPQVNQIVKGINAGTFVVLALRTMGGQQGAQLKSYDPATGRTGRGELFLPLDAIKAAV